MGLRAYPRFLSTEVDRRPIHSLCFCFSPQEVEEDENEEEPEDDVAEDALAAQVGS